MFESYSRSHKNDSEIVKLSYESLNDQRLTGLGCDLYIVSSNGIGFPAHASVVCSQSDVFQVRNCNSWVVVLVVIVNCK